MRRRELRREFEGSKTEEETGERADQEHMHMREDSKAADEAMKPNISG